MMTPKCSKTIYWALYTVQACCVKRAIVIMLTGRHQYRIILVYKLPLQSVMLGLGLGLGLDAQVRGIGLQGRIQGRQG